MSRSSLSSNNLTQSGRGSIWTWVTIAACATLFAAGCGTGGGDASAKDDTEKECEPCEECKVCEECPEVAEAEPKENAPYPWVLIGSVKITEGKMDADIAKRKVTGERYALRECYIPALKKDPNLAGEMDVQFTVSGSTGKIIASIVRDSTIEDKAVQKCMTTKIKEWSFPKSEGTSVVKFTIGIVPTSL